MGQIINTGNQSVGGHTFNTAYAPTKAELGLTKSGGVSAGMATVTSGILSGIADMAVGFINAGRIKQTADFNASLLDINTRLKRLSAKLEIAKIRERSSSLFSKQRAQYAKAGVKLEGSPAEVMKKDLEDAEYNSIITRLNAETAAWQNQTEGDIGRMEASGAYGAAGLNASSRILTILSSEAISRAR